MGGLKERGAMRKGALLCCRMGVHSAVLQACRKIGVKVCGLAFNPVVGLSRRTAGRWRAALPATLLLATTTMATATAAAGDDTGWNEPEEIAVTRWAGKDRSHGRLQCCWRNEQFGPRWKGKDGH